MGGVSPWNQVENGSGGAGQRAGEALESPQVLGAWVLGPEWGLQTL